MKCRRCSIALRPSSPRNPSERNEALWGEVESRRSALCYWSGDWARSLSIGLAALEKIPADWWYLRAYLRVFLGASFQVSGDLPQAYAAIYASDEPEQGRDYQMLLVSWACFMHWIAADLAGMAQAARRVLATTDLPAFSRLRHLVPLSSGHVLLPAQ